MRSVVRLGRMTGLRGFLMRTRSGFINTILIGAASLICAASFTVLSAQRGPLAPPMVKEGVTEKLSDHVYVIPDGSVSLVPNVAIIVGSRTTVVIDTGLGARNAQAVLREVAKVSKNNDLALATTHFHPEHDLG